MSYTPKYFSVDEFTKKLGATVVEQVYDDANTGTPDADAILLDIESADGEVDSWLKNEYSQTDDKPADRLLRHASMQYAMSFAKERHAEYVRSGEAKTHYGRAEAIMKRLWKSERRLPDATEVPANVGGGVSSVEGAESFPCPETATFSDMGDF